MEIHQDKLFDDLNAGNSTDCFKLPKYTVLWLPIYSLLHENSGNYLNRHNQNEVFYIPSKNFKFHKTSSRITVKDTKFRHNPITANSTNETICKSRPKTGNSTRGRCIRFSLEIKVHWIATIYPQGDNLCKHVNRASPCSYRWNFCPLFRVLFLSQLQHSS